MPSLVGSEMCIRDSRYESRQLDIDLILETIRQNGPFEKWLIMGDFNSVSPVDAGKYADGRLADRLRKEEEKRPALKNLVNGEIDYSVHQRILDFGFIDSARLDKNFSEKNFGARIDFIYICLLYTSDAADDLLCVDLGDRRINKKKT